MDEQALDGGGVEQVAAVGQAAGEPAAALAEQEAELELGALVGEVQAGDAQAGSGQRRLRQVVQAEDHLHHRRVGQAAPRLQLLDEALERQLLVRVGGKGGVAQARQHLLERRRAAQVGAQDQGVDEEADQVLGLDGVAAGDRRADQQVVAAAVPLQQARERRQQGHEQGRLRPPAGLAQRPHQRRRQAQAAHRAALALDRRPRPVGRQLDQQRRSRQPLPPEGELRRQGLAGQPPSLPGRVVRVLQG